jgi:hypothetical protein
MVFSSETVSNQFAARKISPAAPPMFAAPRRPAGRFLVFRAFCVSAALVALVLPTAHAGEPQRVHFTNDIVPVFTKLGCNSGACHGKADGQNGFKLSLFGFEPAEDYEAIVNEARGRRLFLQAPAQSLLLRKPTGAMPHGGGKRLDPGSPYYALLVRWIEQGARKEQPTGRAVTGIEVVPGERLLARGGGQQLQVLARHADGTTTDVTGLAQFETNQPDLAGVSPTGLVTVKQRPGSAAIMARYQTHVGVFRGTVSLGSPSAAPPASEHWIDKLVFARLRELGLPASDVCDDSTFLRRVTIDIGGRLPTREEAKAFFADRATDKRARLIERLLDSQDYADYVATKWSAILRNRRRGASDDPAPTAAFRKWIRDSLAANKPYDQFVLEVLTVTGEEVANPPVVWYRELKDPAAAMEDAAQVFLGQRLGCAKCHHHPMEKWSQQDYWGFAAFFTAVDVKDAKPAKKAKDGTMTPAEPTRVMLKGGGATARNPRTKKIIPPTALEAGPLLLNAGDDPRAKLAEWMTDAKNPFFAKALVNRYWKHFFGHGLVDPEDDLRVTNPPANPELLDALARSFVESKYDLKQLVRAICTSKTYQLSAVPNGANAGDRQNHARFLARRLDAEVLLDAIDVVTLSPSKFKTAPAGLRAVQLPDNLSESYFLSAFGRPDAASACECERNNGATLAQAVHMLNSAEIQAKVAGPRAKALAEDSRPHAERIAELYLTALSRPPSKEEIATLVSFIEAKGGTQAAYEDVIWALINGREFLFNH